MQSLPVIRDYGEIMDDRARMLKELLGVLAEVGAEHALVGGLAVGHHGRARATIDVDLLVPKNKLGKIRAALERRGYGIRVTEDLLRVFERGADPEKDEAVADLVAREANPVLRAAFAETEPAQILGHDVKVVRRGALVALKFHAAVSQTRQLEDRYQDVADMGRVIHARFGPEDAALAHQIGAQCYPGAGDDIDQMIDDLTHRRPVRI